MATKTKRKNSLTKIGKTALCRYDDAECARCGKPITKGVEITKWLSPQGKGAWVHTGCDAVAAPPAPTPEPVVVDVPFADVLPEPAAEFTPEPQAPIIGGCTQEQVHAIAKGHDTTERLIASAKFRVLEDKIADLDKLRQVEIKVELSNGKTHKLKNEVLHPVMDDLLFHAVTLRENVLLVGPTGCGKTYIGEQLARVLKRDFHLIPCSVGLTESGIYGSREPDETGKFGFVPSGYSRGFVNGGVTLWDEIDAIDPNVFLCVNAAFSNGKLCPPKAFGGGVLNRSEEHVNVLTANTFGTGADRVYCGRNQLDAASLNRLTAIEVDYDRDVELKLAVAAGGTEFGTECAARLHKYRSRIDAAKLRRFVTTRDFDRYTKWAKIKGYAYADNRLFTTWNPAEVAKVK